MELGDLTIIAGHNNTGKTYLTYTLYGFLKMWAGWPGAEEYFIGDSGRNSERAQYPDLKALATEAIEKGQAEWARPLSVFHQERQAVMKTLLRTFSKDAIASIFSSKPEAFDRSSFHVELDDSVEPPHEITVDISSKYTNDRFVISQIDDTLVIRYNGESQKSSLTSRASFVFAHAYLVSLFPEFPTPHIFSAERFSITLFHKELDFTKNRLVDMLQKMGDSKNKEDFSPFDLIEKTTSRYAQPIKDNIDYTRGLSEIKKKKSAFYEDKFFDDIKKMMKASYVISTDDEIRFKSVARKEGFDMPLYRASSSARGFLDLYFFLRHKVHKRHLIIIDEPEGHLDTANQILLARLLARLVRSGLKVLITTHSDYLIKEINNLIMLDSIKDRSALPSKLFRKYATEDRLAASSVRAYLTEGNSLTPCEIDKFGIGMPMFEQVIDDINDVSNELAVQLKVDGDE